jgi:hypothetical protein
MLDKETGYVCITMKESSNEYRAPRDQFTRLYAEWKSGAAFLEWTCTDGAPGGVKTALVESIFDFSPEALEGLRENQRADRAANAREI